MIQLTPTLYCFDVHFDAKIGFAQGGYLGWDLQLPNEQSTSTITNVHWDKYELIGTVTPDAIDFDCSSISDDGGCDADGVCWDRSLELCSKGGCQRAKQSFRSLLTSKGCDLTKKHVIIKSKI